MAWLSNALYLSGNSLYSSPLFMQCLWLPLELIVGCCHKFVEFPKHFTFLFQEIPDCVPGILIDESHQYLLAPGVTVLMGLQMSLCTICRGFVDLLSLPLGSMANVAFASMQHVYFIYV